MAVEQINAEGGLLGRNLTIVAEDDNQETTPDITELTNALTRLIIVDKADYVIAGAASGGNANNALVYQDICCSQKKILFTLGTPLVDLTQRVLDNYDKYKYYFRAGVSPNETALDMAYVQSLAALKSATGFSKIGYLLQDTTAKREGTAPYFDSELPKLGFEIVYHNLFAPATIDFTSYFAQAEAAKAQILFAFLPNAPKSATLVNEWYERQSPMVLCGDISGVSDPTFWNTTSGKTEFVLSKVSAVSLSYPITDKTLPAKEAFLDRWGVVMKGGGASAYDVVRFILFDAIKRAGTTETEAVIKALEKTEIDTSLARNFEFTSSHDILVDAAGMTSPSQSGILYIAAQWQNGVQVPVFPEMLRIQAGTTYKFPPWQGPWSNKLTP